MSLIKECYPQKLNSFDLVNSSHIYVSDLDMITRPLIGIIFLLHLFEINSLDVPKDEEAAKKFLEKLNLLTSQQSNKVVIAHWNYASNITEENLKRKLEVESENARLTKELWTQVISYPWRTYKDFDVRRQFQKYSILGTAALADEKHTRLTKITSEMQSIYSTAKTCSFANRTKCDLSLEPDLENIFISSDNPEELKYVWNEWRKASGRKVKKLFSEYVTLVNEAAVLNNFTDNAEFWLRDYEDETFRDQILKLWKQLKPLYLEIHGYVRRKLRLKYGEDIVTRRGPIPAHLLGNMWSQTWGNTFMHTVPYLGAQGEDITEEMIKQGYTPKKMFKCAEEFFTSLNLSAMPETFWNRSILEKPDDGREIICHASAWDFYDQKDFRIKQCTRVNKFDFYTAHHEMGHIQYYLQYKNLPIIYRRGANPGFHEAVGDVMALSVLTNKHLHKIGLLKEHKSDEKVTLNNLFYIGLHKIAFLPFAYLMDLWRWGVFKGNITSENYNENWWKLRETYQGIQAPVHRTEDDFDPGAKFHIVAGVPYIRSPFHVRNLSDGTKDLKERPYRWATSKYWWPVNIMKYFVSFIIQFQFHKSLCEKAGLYEANNPKKALHDCDIYESKEAGNAFAKLLQLGSSKPWLEAMETLTGNREMDAGALLEYFRPLQEWLKKDNEESGEYIGWETTSCSTCHT